MPVYGVSTKTVNEGQVQLFVGVFIVATFAALYFGKSLTHVPTPFGIDLGNALNLAVDGLWFAAAVWAAASPPAGGDAWVRAAGLITFPLLYLLNNRAHAPFAVEMFNVFVVGAGMASGLSIIARRLWGAK